jgi:hypothetical protein
MRILVLCQYYAPEEVGASIWVTEMAEDLVRLGHEVTVATAFPNYPKRQVFDAYKGKKFQREMLNGVEVWRSYIYANPSESTKSRLLNWASFCASSCLSIAFRRKKHDVIYAIMPPLPLGMVAAWLKKSGKMTDLDGLWAYTTQFNSWSSKLRNGNFFGSGYDKYADTFYPISLLRNSKWVNR